MTSTHAILEVPGVSCSHCKAAIEGAVGAVDGVGQVVVDVGEKSGHDRFRCRSGVS